MMRIIIASFAESCRKLKIEQFTKTKGELQRKSIFQGHIIQHIVEACGVIDYVTEFRVQSMSLILHFQF